MTESVADVVREMKMCGDRDECWERGMSDNSWLTRIEAAHAREIAEMKAEIERWKADVHKASVLGYQQARDDAAREVGKELQK